MANTIAGVNPAQVAQMSLPHLAELFAPLSALTTDFSTDISGSGESVTTRFPSSVTANDMTGGFQTGAQDVAMTARTITLDQFPGFTYGFSDLERSKSDVDLMRLFLEPAMEAVGTAVFSYIWNLITAANFTNTPLVKTAANFDRDSIVDLGVSLTDAKALQSNRSLWLNTGYYGSVVKSYNSAEYPGNSGEKAEANVLRTAKFDVYETTLADENAENLQGFALQKAALIMAARTVIADEMTSKAGVDVETVVIPGLGLPVQFRKWYDADGKLYWNMNVLFGASLGLVNAGTRITDV